MVTSEHLDHDWIVDGGVVQFLEVHTKTVGDRLGYFGTTSSVVSKTSFTAALGDDDLACERLIVLDTNVVITVAVADLDFTGDSGRSSSEAWLACLVRSLRLRFS